MMIHFFFLSYAYSYALFEDVNNSYTYEEILNHEALFANTNERSFGITPSSFWLKVTLENSSNAAQKRYILFDYSFLKHVTAYTTNDIQSNGYAVPLKEKLIPIKEIVFSYEIPPHTNQEVYIHIKSDLFIRLSYNILDEYHTIELAQMNTILETAILAGLIVLFLYNIFIYLSMRQHILLYYLGYLLSVIMIYANLNNYLLIFDFMTPYRVAIQSFSISFLAAFSVLFVWELLFKKIPKWLQIVTFLYLLLKTMLTLYDPVLSIFLGVKSKLMLIYIVGMSGVLLYAFIKKHPLAKYLLLGWSFFVMGSAIHLLILMGYIDNYFVKYSLGIGALLEALTFSLVSSYQYKLIQNKSLRLEKNYALELEKEVSLKTKKLQTAVNTKNVLLRELFHRVKNNLQIISGFISLEINRHKEEKIQDILNHINLRIFSISLLYEKLFQSDQIEEIAMPLYIAELIEELKKIYPTKDIHFDIHCEHLVLNIDTSVGIGLIINEVVTNAIKYAFDDKQASKIITLKMQYKDMHQIMLEIYDNGKGAEDEVKKGFGMKLIRRLVNDQLNGSIVCTHDKGFYYKILIPISQEYSITS